jgi:hypothetical protein
MTMSPGEPGPTDFEGKEVPPYEGRQGAQEVDGEDKVRRDRATVGGATGPAESSGRKAPEPADTARGAVAAPADEHPAGRAPSGDEGEAPVGPAHYAGTTRGESVSEDKHEKGGLEEADNLGDGL